MNLSELIQKRQSDRKYESRPVSREMVMKCLEAARLAPSACNSQPWKFGVVAANGSGGCRDGDERVCP